MVSSLGTLIAAGLALGQTLPEVLSPLLARVYG